MASPAFRLSPEVAEEFADVGQSPQRALVYGGPGERIKRDYSADNTGRTSTVSPVGKLSAIRTASFRSAASMSR